MSTSLCALRRPFLGMPVAVAVLGLAYGSFELLPTAEQAGKLRIVSSLALAMLLVVESILGLLVRRLSGLNARQSERPGPA